MCAGHFSVDVMKHHEQGNLQRGSFELMDPEGSESMMAEGDVATGAGRVAGSEAEGSHLQLQAQRRESKLKMRDILNSQNPPPVTYFLQRGHISSTYPNNVWSHYLETKYSNAQGYGGGHLSFKPPQNTKQKR